MNRDAVEIGPAWSPDGARIAFSSNHDGDHEICVMNSDGSGLVQLTDNGVDDVNPFWSPDGRYLGFSHDDPNNAVIYITSPDRPVLLRLTDHPGDDSGGSWTPHEPSP